MSTHVEERIAVSRTITLTRRDADRLERLAHLSGRSQSQVVRILLRRATPGDVVYGAEEAQGRDGQ
ncbi:MAG: ribbon-helix-helix protein, CopG family [Chloroflexi bacterium]|nr:ribbon-helix-helix protein, CopG family [Chloroflexota bacterium]